MANPNKASKKEIAVVGGVVATAAVGFLAINAFDTNRKMEKARSAESEVLKDIEARKSNVEVEDFTLVLRKGVNVRSQPYLVMAGENDKSDANTAWEVDQETRVEKPLSVTRSTDEGTITYYLIPKQGEDVSYLKEGTEELNPDAFDWVDGRVVGQISNSTGKKYAEIEYPDPSEPSLPAGQIKITNTSVGFETVDGTIIPVSQVSK